jgi:ubiquinone biosynthesis accessory factor UbiJ
LSVLEATLGNLLNRGLPRSGRARELTAELAGRSLALEVQGLGWLRLESNGSTLNVAPGAGPADATLSTGPLSLVTLALGDPQAAVQRGAVTFSGDTETAAAFRELLGLLKPDAEEELSLVLGDVAAHRLARLARGVLRFSRGAASVAWRNGADYLAHERADLVPRHEGEQFLRGVDALREDLDRLEARLALLAQRRSAGTRSAAP